MENGKRLSQEEVVERINQRCNEQGLEFLGFANEENCYKNNKTKLILKCKTCGYEWDSTAFDKLMSKQSRKCPKCSGHYHYTDDELIEIAKARCKELDYKFIGFTDKGKHTTSSKIILKCNKCGEIWDTTTINNLCKMKRKSHTCGRKNPSEMPSHHVSEEKIVSQINEKLQGTNLEFIGFEKEFTGRKNCYILLKCKLCGVVSSYRLEALLYDNDVLKCKKCEYNGKLTNEEAIKNIVEMCNLLDYAFIGFNNESNRYDGKETRLILKCNKCGYIWKSTSYYNLIRNKISCRGCTNIWKMEKEVKEILKRNNILFEEQKKFDWLKNKIKLSLDFYLPNYYAYIECQGIQHFEPVDRFGGEADFKETTERDNVKRMLCDEHKLVPIYYCQTKKYDTYKGEKVVRNEKELLEKINKLKDIKNG